MINLIKEEASRAFPRMQSLTGEAHCAFAQWGRSLHEVARIAPVFFGAPLLMLRS